LLFVGRLPVLALKDGKVTSIDIEGQRVNSLVSSPIADCIFDLIRFQPPDCAKEPREESHGVRPIASLVGSNLLTDSLEVDWHVADSFWC